MVVGTYKIETNRNVRLKKKKENMFRKIINLRARVANI